MATCSTEQFQINFDQIGKVPQTTTIYADVLESVESCNKQNTNESVATTGFDSVVYDPTVVPADKFGCDENPCFNSGTLKGERAAEQTSVSASYVKAFDASEIATGVVTGYVYLPADGTYTVSLTIADFSDTTLTNADVYNVTVDADNGEGTYPVLFDLSQTPATVTGDGWTPSAVGLSYKLSIAGEADGEYGFSSIQFFDSIEELEKNETVAMTCPVSFDGNDVADIVDEACGQSGYDENSASTDITLSVNKVSSNYYKLHPNAYVSDETMAGVPAVTSKTAVKETINGIDYAVVQVADIDENECGFTMVSIPGCGSSGSLLKRVNAPVPVSLPGDAFQILTTDSGSNNRGKILMNASLVGQKLNIVYPQAVSVKVTDVKTTFREGLKVRLMVPVIYKGGKTVFHQYTNVLMTQFPVGWSSDDGTPREFQFRVGADDNGVRYRVIEQQ